MSYTLRAVAVMGAALIVSGRASAQGLVTQHNLSLAMAKTIAEATLAECKAKGAHSSAVVVDRAGQVLVMLRDWRGALVSFSAIPLTLLTTVWILDAFGLSLNTMTLGGLVVALGVVVDAATWTAENMQAFAACQAHGARLPRRDHAAAFVPAQRGRGLLPYASA